MQALVAVIAVAGTLLGSLITYVFQRKTIERTENFARAERLQDEQLRSYSTLAGACAHSRRAEMDRWHRHAEDPGSERDFAARLESYQLRTNALEALFRVQLVTKDVELSRVAGEAVELTRQIHHALDEGDLLSRVRIAQEAIDSFVRAAAAHIA